MAKKKLNRRKKSDWSSYYDEGGEETSGYTHIKNPEIAAHRKVQINRIIVGCMLAALPISVISCFFAVQDQEIAFPTTTLPWESNPDFDGVAQTAAEVWAAEQEGKWEVVREIDRNAASSFIYTQENTFIVKQIHSSNRERFWRLTLGITENGGAVPTKPIEESYVDSNYDAQGRADICLGQRALPGQHKELVDSFITAYVDGDTEVLRQLARGTREDAAEAGEDWPVYWQAGKVNLVEWQFSGFTSDYRIDCYDDQNGAGWLLSNGESGAFLRATLSVEPKIGEGGGEEGSQNAISTTDSIDFIFETDSNGVFSVYGASDPGFYGVQKAVSG